MTWTYTIISKSYLRRVTSFPMSKTDAQPKRASYYHAATAPMEMDQYGDVSHHHEPMSPMERFGHGVHHHAATSPTEQPFDAATSPIEQYFHTATSPVEQRGDFYNHHAATSSNENYGDISLVSSIHDPDKEIPQQTETPRSTSTLSDDVKENVGKPGAKPELQKTKSQADKLGTFKITIIMMSLCMALFLAALDVTIITTALPTIAGHFHASSADYTWIGSAYLLACAASVPLWGKISDIWGRKPIILTANIIFMVGSLIAALANSVKMLIAGRVVQGIGGGGLVILCNICVSDLFSMRDRAKYFGILGGVWAVASAVGPVLGGIFTEKVSWRWCFCTYSLASRHLSPSLLGILHFADTLGAFVLHKANHFFRNTCS